MKILLVNPPRSDRSVLEEEYGVNFFKKTFKGEPLALEEIAGNLDPYETDIFDMKADPLPLEEKIAAFRPDLIGITGVTCEANTVVKLSGICKRMSPATVVVGGHHATYQPEFFNVDTVDYVCLGLGKVSFRRLADSLAGRNVPDIPGMVRTRPGSDLPVTRPCFTAADLAEERAPSYGLVEKYRNRYFVQVGFLKFNIGCLCTAMGCTHKCTFCAIPKITNDKYLSKSTASVVRDLALLKKTKIVRLVDANTFGNIPQSWELFESIRKNGIRKRFLADIRADTIARNPDLLKAWKSVGLSHVVVGFEEINNDRLNRFNKKYSASVIDRAVEILHDLKIRIVGDFIASCDYTERDFQALETAIKGYGIDIPVVSILTPVPGTPLYDELKDQIEIRDLDYYNYLNAVLKTRLPKKEFYGLYSHLVRAVTR